jgi:DHA1 family tetracycline resistance protein-like MFS transporter
MRKSNAAVPFILITILIDMLGIGIVVPVWPKVVTSMTGGDLSEGAWTYGVFIASYALMQFIFSPVLGNLSDAFGRRPVLLLSLFGSAIDYVILALAPNLTWLFAGRILAGITGANIAVANAYVADTSPIEQRARNFGLIGACFGIGFILGPVVGGALAAFGPRVPFVAAAILTFSNFLYGVLVLPESHPKENRRPFRWGHSNAWSAFRKISGYPLVAGLLLTLALDRLAHDAFPATWVLYVTYKFQWTELHIGLTLALVGVVVTVVQAGLTGPVVARIGERNALLAGLFINATACAMYGVLTHGWMIYAVIIYSGIAGIAGPSLQSLITKPVPLNEQGGLQGTLTSVQSVMMIIGPLIATGLFGYFTSERVPLKVPGAPFLASAVLVVIAVAVAAYTTRPSAIREAISFAENADPATAPEQ